MTLDVMDYKQNDTVPEYKPLLYWATNIIIANELQLIYGEMTYAPDIIKSLS